MTKKYVCNHSKCYGSDDNVTCYASEETSCTIIGTTCVVSFFCREIKPYLRKHIYKNDPVRPYKQGLAGFCDLHIFVDYFTSFWRLQKYFLFLQESSLSVRYLKQRYHLYHQLHHQHNQINSGLHPCGCRIRNVMSLGFFL